MSDYIDKEYIEKLGELNEFENVVFFEGVCHPEGKNEDYNGYFMKKSEIKDWADKVCGKEIWSEHNKQKKIGEVVGGRLDEKNQFRIIGMIDTTSFDGSQTVTDMRTGKKTGLSLGLEHLEKHTPFSIDVVDKDINEISVVKSPDLNTHISYVQPLSKKKQILRNIFDSELTSIKFNNQLRQGFFFIKKKHN